jgi:hypothetical protein
MKVAEPPGSEPKTSMSYSINNITAKEEARSLTATITLDADPAYTQVQMAFQLDAEAHTTTRFRTVYLTALSAAMAHCQARASCIFVAGRLKWRNGCLASGRFLESG